MRGGENLTKKKRRSAVPASTTVRPNFFLTSADFDGLMLPDGYQRLSDNPEVRIAVDKIADLVSNMTIHLVENTDKGDVRVKNELSRKLDVNPFKWMTRKTWLYKIVQDLLLDGEGNSIVYPTYQDGFLADLKPFAMGEVSYDYDYYDYSISYQGKNYTSDSIVHFVLNPDSKYPWKGTGYRIALADIVRNLKQANKTKNSFMTGQYMPNVIVKVDAMSEELASEAGRKQIKEKYLKQEPGEPWIIPAEMLEVQSVKPLSIKDIAINESVELDKKTVAGLLGVPAFFIGVGVFNKDEYNNFINTRIMSIAQIIAQTLTKNLLYSPRMYFRLNPRSLYAYNLTDQVSAGTQLIDRNTMRRNELRDWIGLDPDPEMEELIVLENYIPASQSGDQQKLKGGDDE